MLSAKLTKVHLCPSAISALRSAESDSLLQEIIAAGAAGGSHLGLHTPAGEPGFLELKRRGYVVEMTLMDRTDHDHYTLTDLGRKHVYQCSKLHSPQMLLQFERSGLHSDLGLEQQTTAELILFLGTRGWKDIESKKSKRFRPFQPGTSDAEKHWYRTEGRPISKLYLRCLALASDPDSELPVTELFHFQSQAYYKCVLFGCNVLPNQPLAYYKLILKQKKGDDVHVSEDEADSDAEHHVRSGEILDEPSDLFQKGADCKIYLFFVNLHS